MKSWFELNHLRIADSLNNRPKKNILFLYFTHMIIGIREATVPTTENIAIKYLFFLLNIKSRDKAPTIVNIIISSGAKAW